VRALGEQSGVRDDHNPRPGRKKVALRGHGAVYGDYPNEAQASKWNYGDTGTAARFFPMFRYVAKASRSERNRGCEALPEQAYPASGAEKRITVGGGKATFTPRANTHPTVKPLALMTWLITLITPPGGLVLDPFAGSGSTLVAAKAGGWRYLGIEREAEYVAIAQARLAATRAPSLGSAEVRAQPAQSAKPAKKKPRATKAPKATPPAPLWDAQEFSA
jgi:site-specific DNA-methyltransferase (adenine-specific)